MFLRLLLVVPFCIICLFSSSVFGATLRPGGLNVCSRKYTYNTYYKVTRHRIDYVNYRTCCKKFWGICTSRCKRSRTRLVYYTVNKLKVKTSVSYFCCPGWARTGNQCPNAICRPSCQNGNCIAPNVCKCKSGFAGKYCEREIDECKAKPSPCQQTCTNLRGSYACSCKRGYRKIGNGPKDKGCQNVNECLASSRLCMCAVDKKDCKATCVDVIGSYRCQCSSGYRLISNKICTDVNECRTGTHGCQQICLNLHGGYKCACRTGYWLRSDKRTCYDLNECRSANGGCEQLCTNTVGSYRCSCRTGFNLLYDKTRCKDVDECLRYRPCDQTHGLCQNTYGSYKCSCRKGYELKRDGKTCVDINECEGANQCKQNCHNSEGSYFCSCRKGFTLAPDRISCVDIDECKRGLHDCDHICVNNFGSFRCQCKAGYVLQDNKKSCRALPCKKLYPPHNGFVRCMGLNLGQKCTYTCRTGYKVVGSKERTCQISSRWSGGVARCFPESCQPARPPMNGFLLLPCVSEYKSTCIVNCKKGFLLTGSNMIKCALVNRKVAWKNTDASCEEIKLCQPNPCKNGGKCRIKSNTDFECDCSGTGFSGENCQFGHISITPYPPLILGKQSGFLTITAKPSKELVIIPEAVGADVVFFPKKITISYPRSSVQFKIIPRTSGLVRIKYQLTGWNRLQFAPLKDSLVYVSPLEASERISRIPDKNFPDVQCHKMKLDKCLDGRSVEMLSSCPWTKSGTTGYQSVSIGTKKVPFSLAGLSLPKEGISTWIYRTRGVLTVSKETTDMLKKGPIFCRSSSACKNSILTKAEHRFLVQQNFFMRSVLHANSKLLPDWMSIHVQNGYTGFHVNNFQSMILKSYRMMDLPLCFNFPKKFPSGIYVTQVAFLPITLQVLSKKFSTESTYPTCIARSVCDDLVYYSLPKDKALDLAADLKAINIKSMKLRVRGLGFSGKPAMKKSCWRTFDTRGNKFTQECFDPKIFLKISGSISVGLVNFTVNGEAFFAPSNLQMAAINRFSLENKYSYQGQIFGSVAMKAGGKIIKFQFQDDAAKGYGTVGGVGLDPFKNTFRGLNFQTSSDVLITHETTLVTFHSLQSGNSSDLQFTVLSDITGGDISTVQNAAKIRLMMRSLSRSIPASTSGLLLSLRQRRTIYRAEYAVLESFKKNAVTPLLKIKDIVSKPNADYRTVEKALLELRNLIESVSDVVALLESRVTSTEQSFAVKRRILMRIRFMKRIINSAFSLNAVPKSRPVSEKYSGLVLKYTGKICFNAICFDGMRVSVFDLKSTDKIRLKNPDSLYISATFMENQSIAGLFNVSKDSVLRAEVSRNTDSFSLELPAITKVFGKRISVTLKINPTKAGFILADFELSRGAKFNLDVSAKNTKSTTWQSLFFEITGATSQKSDIKTNIKTLVTKYIKDTSTLIKERLGSALGKIQTLVKEVKSKKANLKPKKTTFDREIIEYRRLHSIYNASLAVMHRSLKTFRSYRASEFFRNIEKQMNNTCAIEQCDDVCIPVPICGVCQEAVMVDANTLKCDTISKKVITTVEQPFESQCQLTDYRFTPIYTGTCKRGKGAKLNAALAGVGAGIGFIAGGPIGAAIGGIIGGIAGLFSSCDETYTVYKEVINRQVGCTLKTFKPKSKFWKEAACYTLKKNVLSGYDNPKECKCNNNTCVVVQSPLCVQDNARCVEKRKVVVRSNMEKAGVYNNSYEKLERAQNAVKLNFIKLLQGEKTYLFAQRDYEKGAALLRQAELEVKLANASLKNSNQNFALELCLGRVNTNDNGYLKVNKISFESEAAAQENILFKLDVQAHGSMRQKTFLFDLRDTEVSLKRGARRLAREIFCPAKSRGRRSIDSKGNDENAEELFIQSDASIPKDATDAQRACLASKTIFSFLKRSNDDLLSRIHDLEKKQRDLEESIKSINNNLKTSDNAVLKNQNQLLSTLKDNLRKDSVSLTAYDVIYEWLANMETATGVSNFTKCLNFEDCIHESHRQLKAMPSLMRVKRDDFDSMIDIARFNFFKIISARSVPDLLQAAINQRNNLGDIMQASLFCEGKPEVKLLPETKVAVTVGSMLRLRCSVNSLLPVEYSWMHNKAHLLSEDSNMLMIKVDSTKQGSYRCIATNLAGKGTSQETFVEVRQPPIFVHQPQDFLYYFSMAKEIVPHFVCNVTADPPPTISWYFRTYDTSKITQFAYSKPVLHIQRPTVSESGFYYCTAENPFGKITSKSARLDVLKSRLPNQAFSVSYNVQVGRSGAPEKTTYERDLRSEGKLTTSQDLDVSYEYKSGRELNITVRVTENLEKVTPDTDSTAVSALDMLRAVSRSRQTLSGVMERIVTGLTRNRGRSANNALQKSMRIGFNGELCKRGYFLHANGFTCVECPTGSFEHNGKCINCSMGTYQNEPGQTSCLKCDENQVTQSVGSVNRYQCIAPELKSADVIFALDSSGSIGWTNWKKVKSFVAKFALEFGKDENDLNIGVVTFDTTARVRIPLRNYASWQLKSRINYLSYYGGATRTSEGLRMARGQFKRAYKAGRKQILFVMTDGKSTDIGGMSGFILARRMALELLSDGIHIVSVGVGNNVDPAELRAIASYPKEENVIRYGSFRSLVTASKRILATALRGNCFSQLKDIAIVVEASSAIRSNRWKKTRQFVSELLSKLSVTSDNKVSVSTFSTDLRIQRSFKEIEPQKEIKNIVQGLTKESKSADYKRIAQDIYNNLLNEKGGSFSQTKIVILLTKNVFDRSLLTKITRDYPTEKVRFVGVAMGLKSEDDFDDVSSSFEEKNSFSLTQLSNLVQLIKTINFSNRSCQS